MDSKGVIKKNECNDWTNMYGLNKLQDCTELYRFNEFQDWNSHKGRNRTFPFAAELVWTTIFQYPLDRWMIDEILSVRALKSLGWKSVALGYLKQTDVLLEKCSAMCLHWSDTVMKSWWRTLRLFNVHQVKQCWNLLKSHNFQLYTVFQPSLDLEELYGWEKC